MAVLCEVGNEFRVCGSVHLQIFNKTTNQMQQSILYLFLCRVNAAQHVLGTIVPIIRSPLQLPLQPLVTV
jgi:hypothetical protein